VDVLVIVPTLNRKQLLLELLASLSKMLSGGLDWEVLVIDNGSNDGTVEAVTGGGDTWMMKVRIVREPRPGLHVCRNRGGAEEAAAVIAYLDDDMLVSPRWLQGARHILNGRADMVAGRILPFWDSPPPDLIRMLCEPKNQNVSFGFLGIFDSGDTVQEISALNAFGGNAFIKQSLIKELGGFHPDSMPSHLLRFRGDGETGFAYRFMADDRRCIYDPDAYVYHRIAGNRMTDKYLYKRAFNQGVSDSFTNLRCEHGLGGQRASCRYDYTLRNRLRDTKYYGEILLRYYLKMMATGSSALPLKRKLVAENIRAAQRSGYAFHRKIVATDRAVREWVLRNDYMGDNGIVPL
jgi:glycosyltransferase involved in cell wall biosynthesis